MKKYFVKYYNDFSNCYGLMWATNGMEVPNGAQQITRREAIALCIEERRRRKEQPMSSGYADIYIYQVDLTDNEDDRNIIIIDGYIAVRKSKRK